MVPISYNVNYGGNPVFDLRIKSSYAGAPLVVLEPDDTATVSLDAGTDYYLRIEQTGDGMTGGDRSHDLGRLTAGRANR
jgi:hypothetical protein